MNEEDEAQRISDNAAGKLFINTAGDAHNCRAIGIIKGLFAANKLPNFSVEYFTFFPAGAPTGNCHIVSFTLIQDLRTAGESYGWMFVSGIGRNGQRQIPHSWLEYDGWSVDAARNVVRFARIELFRKTHKFTNIIEMDPRDSIRWYVRAAAKTKDGMIDYDKLLK